MTEYEIDFCKNFTADKARQNVEEYYDELKIFCMCLSRIADVSRAGGSEYTFKKGEDWLGEDIEKRKRIGFALSENGFNVEYSIGTGNVIASWAEVRKRRGIELVE